MQPLYWRLYFTILIDHCHLVICIYFHSFKFFLDLFLWEEIYHDIISIILSHARKVMFKILQARLQQYVNWELLNVQVRFRKCRGTRDHIGNILWIIKKAREFQKKTSISASMTRLKPLTVWITTRCGKFWKRWEYQTTLSASWEICMQVKRQQLGLEMEQQTAFKLERKISSLCIVTLLI